ARARTTRRTARPVPRSSPRAGTPGPSALAERPRRSRCQEYGADPGRVLTRLAAQVEPVGRLRPVPGDDVHQLVPVGLGVVPAAGLLVLAQLWIRHRQAELPDLRHVAVEELLPRLVVALALDPPDEHRILFAGDRVAVELHQR